MQDEIRLFEEQKAAYEQELMDRGFSETKEDIPGTYYLMGQDKALASYCQITDSNFVGRTFSVVVAEETLDGRLIGNISRFGTSDMVTFPNHVQAALAWVDRKQAEMVILDPGELAIEQALKNPVYHQAWTLPDEEIKDLSDADFRSIHATLEEHNLHSEVVILNAKRLGGTRDIMEAEDLHRMQELAGYLTPEIAGRRQVLVTKIAGAKPLENPTVIIKVTSDEAKLTRVWDSSYAKSNCGKTFSAQIDSRGWAIAEHAKFPPTCFEVVPPTNRVSTQEEEVQALGFKDLAEYRQHERTLLRREMEDEYAKDYQSSPDAQRRLEANGWQWEQVAWIDPPENPANMEVLQSFMTCYRERQGVLATFPQDFETVTVQDFDASLVNALQLENGVAVNYGVNSGLAPESGDLFRLAVHLRQGGIKNLVEFDNYAVAMKAAEHLEQLTGLPVEGPPLADDQDSWASPR